MGPAGERGRGCPVDCLGLPTVGKLSLWAEVRGGGGRSREQISAGLPGWVDFIRKVTENYIRTVTKS